ncbi:MAG: quinone-dependent dihydroorotate dehydrogenase [Patescibacteria group bacterium]
MKDFSINIRNKILGFLYETFAKPIFFQIDPETVHNSILLFGKFLGSNPITRFLTKLLFHYSNKKLEQTILGIHFKNPIGLAAGFDKDAELTKILPETGFGFIEVGSITGLPCEGNPRPRLWRLKKSKGLVVYYGLKNDGCEKIAKKLKNKKFKIPVGTSIAKTNCKETSTCQTGIDDYVKAYKEFTEIGGYFTINISCPNTFGGEPFTNPEHLDKLLTEIDKIKTQKPIFLKISPDLNDGQIDKIIEVVEKHDIKGFVCTNITKNRDNAKILEKNLPKAGGVSGRPLKDLSDKLISYVYKKTKGKYIIIGCGGIFTAEDAYKKIRLGASLLQLITGMIFEGPQVISEINYRLIKLLKKDGYKNISEAVGKGL